MLKSRMAQWLVTCLLVCCSLEKGWAQEAPTPDRMLAFSPKQTGVEIASPKDFERSSCKVELVKGVKNAQGKTPSGWLLRDAQGQPLRCFLDVNADNRVDVWCYYRRGLEGYREIDTNYDGKVDQYRWLGPNGSRWGSDENQDGRIDRWKVISPEEVSQEVLAAVITRDFTRLQALMITKAELGQMDLPEGEVARLTRGLGEAGLQFRKTTAQLIKLSDETRWVHLETTAPECIAADALGSKVDLIRYPHATILYENAGKHDWLQTGPLVQVGRAWRVVQAPVPGSHVEQVAAQVPEGAGIISVDEKTQPLLDELKKVDAQVPNTSDPVALTRYNLARAAVLEKIVAACTPEQRAQWIRQLADCLNSAAQSSRDDRTALQRLQQLQEQLARSVGQTNVTAYVTYRQISAEYAQQLNQAMADPKKMNDVQERWRSTLGQFVEAYPAAEDTPEALLQLGMVSEFMGKNTEAINWYSRLAKQFRTHKLGSRAAGAVRRLELDGQILDLAGPQLGTGRPFDVDTLRGKPYVVYYWASWNTQCAEDFRRLAELKQMFGRKGLEIVCVNLDNSEAPAMSFLQAHRLEAYHLFQAPGGLESPLAVQYGVMVLPNLFVVDKSGRVVNRNGQMATLQDDLGKLFD